MQELEAFLADSRSRLLKALDGVSAEELQRRPGPEKWSPLEIVEHLALAEEWFLQIVTRLAEEGQQQGLRYVAGAPRTTDAVPVMAEYVDVRGPLAAPEPVHPRGEGDLDSLLARLARSRQGLVALLPTLAQLDTDRLIFRHPTHQFPLNALQWIHLSGLHDRVHARQIRTAVMPAS